jgi:dolichol-phosphate mannosyltransferase
VTPDRVPGSAVAPVVRVVIPTYDEADNALPMCDAVLAQLAARGWDGHVLIVDDNSPDGTGEIVAAAAQGNPRIGVLRRTGKDGLGVAYRDGFRRALREGADAICQMDADFSHRPEDLPALAQGVLDGRADVAIGSRYVPGGGTSDWSRIRLVLSRIGAAWCRVVLGVKVRDISGGFKAWAPAALTVAVEQAHSAGFAFQAEATFLASRAGYRAVEVPITFQERAAGESKMSPRITIEGAWRLVALRWAHRRGR